MEKPASSKGWRRVRRLLIGLVVLATLIALFYAEEDWRGKRAWDEYRRGQEAQGEQFDRAHFIPPAVPDDQNFAMIPLLAPMFDFLPGTQNPKDTNAAGRLGEAMHQVGIGYSNAPVTSGNNSWVWPREDSRAWYARFLQYNHQNSNSVANLDLTKAATEDLAARTLAVLAPANGVLDELRAGARRPYSRFNIKYDRDDPAEIMLPHIGAMKRVCNLLQLRASAELSLGRTGEAFEDIKLMFRLIEAIRNESFLISQLVRFVELGMVLQPISEGLSAHQWSDPQLQFFQQQLETIDFCADTQRGMQGERACFGGGLFDYLRHLSIAQRIRLFDEASNWSESQKSSSFLPRLFMAAPNGWFYLEQLNYDRFDHDYLLPAIDPGKRQISPSIVEAARARSADAQNQSALTVCLRHQIFSVLLIPSMPTILERTGRAQTGADLGAIACALERYRLAHGQLPAALDALVPQFMGKLPHDVVNGQPLHYRPGSDGRFVLYSVGWNEKDDGGIKSDDSAIDLPHLDREVKPPAKNGDWVWSSK